ncbi:MAG: hypothetical protein EBV06_05240 [Planctomycetia bacterium]|nr:hypothetical protein [Planctomycetia bacterium]
MTALLALALLAPISDTREPYRVTLVVSVAKSRLLTKVFRQQVERELRDGLQAALGPLAKVSVTASHPLLADIWEIGLDRAVGGCRDRGPGQTHFVTIGYDGVHYEIQTRMHDGITGLASPVGRYDTTRDRAFVARLAALMIEQDLALTGTVITEPDAGQQVKVELRGGLLGELSRWIKKDVLFSLTSVPSSGPGRLQPFLFLQVVSPPQEGVCVCRVLRRYRLTALTGMTATLMPTRSGPLRLRLMQEGPRGLVPLNSPVTLEIRRHGFEGEIGSLLRLPASGNRDVDTLKRGEQGRFDRVAFVSVLSGTNVLARVPVPLIDEGVIVIPVPTVNEEEGGIQDRFRMLLRNAVDAEQVQGSMFEDINKLTKEPSKRGTAIAHVKETLARLRDDHVRLSKEREAVRIESEKLKTKLDWKIVDQRLERLRSGEKDLLVHVSNLEKIEREENDPKRREWLIKKAEADSLVKQADVAEALKIYRSAPEEFKTEEYRKFVETLEAKWKPIDEEHAKARTFIYERWGGMSTNGIKDNLAEAKKSLQTCISAGDLYGSAKFRDLTLKHVVRMDSELKALKPDVNADDEQPAMIIKELFPELRKMVEDAEAAAVK